MLNRNWRELSRLLPKSKHEVEVVFAIYEFFWNVYSSITFHLTIDFQCLRRITRKVSTNVAVSLYYALSLDSKLFKNVDKYCIST